MQKIRLALLWSIIFISSYQSFSQNKIGEASYLLQKTHEKITIDGKLNEMIWKKVPKGGGFYQFFPTDSQPAKDSTQFMITYNEDFIYVAIICYDSLPGKPITNSLKRDFIWPSNDNVSFYVDPYDDKSNGFTFQITPYNTQREGLAILGGEIQSDWDNKWWSEVSIEKDRWIVEMAIPFKSFRYNSIKKWNIQFLRNNQKRNERSSWIRVPQQFRASDPVYYSTLQWDTLPPKAGTNFVFIPYTGGNIGRNFEDGEPLKKEIDFGFDSKIGLTNSLNLDLTVNPDFSQVEVDRQVTNLQRFEISFPERRQFFLENQDLFAQNGFRSSRPFFSRRIGIQGSGSTQRNVPILAGARLSGKITNKWRVGMLNMTTQHDETTEEISPSQNYSVAVIERQIFKRSRISAVLVGRNNLGFVALDSFRVENNKIFDEKGNIITNPKDTLFTLSKYNYVYGLDYNLATINNRWRGNFYYHRSIDPKIVKDNLAHGAFVAYQTTKINLRVFTSTIGEGYNAEVGFIPRTGVTRSGTRIDFNYFTKGKIQRHGPSTGAFITTDRTANVLDRQFSGGYGFSFLNSSAIEGGMEWRSVKLTDDFDPSSTEGEELKEGEEYNWLQYGFSYNSDTRKPFRYEISGRRGKYYNGDINNIIVNMNYRYQPFVQLGINFEYNDIKLPKPYNSADLFLLGTRVDLTFSNKVFFTSFLQYNTQDKNFGHNSRFQWRFKPVSDFFIVYTDNYHTGNFSTKNRAFFIKISYWLNL